MKYYSDLIQQQNYLNPTHPKLFAGKTSSFSYPSLSQVITELNAAPYQYTGLVTLPGSIFNLTTSQLSLEFILSPEDNDFPNHKFLYCPVAEIGQLNNVPSIKSLNASTPLYLVLKPTKPNLIYSNLDRFQSYYTLDLGTQTFNHIFLPYFEFTGRVSIQQDKLIYEYQDAGGYLGVVGELYISYLRPHQLSYPLGAPTSDELAEDPCLESLVGAFPTVSDEYFIGEFTGFTTTSQYSEFKFYQYYNPYRYQYFLSEYTPHLSAQPLSKFFGLIKEQAVYIHNEYSTQSLEISQTSTLNKVNFI